MQLITTTLFLTDPFCREIVNLAICGASDEWAEISDLKANTDATFTYISATFTDRNNPTMCKVITEKSILVGVDRILSGAYPIAPFLKHQLLLCIVNDDASDMQMPVADHIVRAAMMDSKAIALMAMVSAPQPSGHRIKHQH